jgi:tetratricopeptide (TPR) repeat protein
VNQELKDSLRSQAQRKQSAGRYDEAIADYLAASDLSLDAPLQLWRQRSSAATETIVPLIRAMRELEISRIAIDEYLAAIDGLASGYQGFTSVDPSVLTKLDKTCAVAENYLRRSGPTRRREHLDMMLDIAEDDIADRSHGPSLLAYRYLRPIHARVHFITARWLLTASHYQGAHDHLEKAIRLAPCYGPAYRLLGEALVGLGRGAAAARCFDCAAAFWNPDWWSIEFPRGTQMRVPGIVIRGHDIFYWENTFLAVKITPRRRRLRMLALAKLRRLYNAYRSYYYAYRSYRARSRQRWHEWGPFPRGRIGFGAIASAVLRLPGALWVWLRLRPVVLPARARLGRSTKRAMGSSRAGLHRLRSTVASWIERLFPPRPANEPTPRRTWRASLARWVAQAEIMWGAQPALRAPSLHEMLELLERADA